MLDLRKLCINFLAKCHFLETMKDSGIVLNAPVYEVISWLPHGSEMLLVLPFVIAV